MSQKFLRGHFLFQYNVIVREFCGALEFEKMILHCLLAQLWLPVQ